MHQNQILRNPSLLFTLGRPQIFKDIGPKTSNYAFPPGRKRVHRCSGYSEPFHFSPVYSLDVLNEINALNTGKKRSGPIPLNILSCVSGVYFEEIKRNINKSFELTTFPSNLKSLMYHQHIKLGIRLAKKYLTYKCFVHPIKNV